MIYIVTPHKNDFEASCKKIEVPAPINGSSKDVTWIHHWHQLMGRRLYRTDFVMPGAQIAEFDKDTLKRIEAEIAIRWNDLPG
jgi:hypothetical protein